MGSPEGRLVRESYIFWGNPTGPRGIHLWKWIIMISWLLFRPQRSIIPFSMNGDGVSQHINNTVVIIVVVDYEPGRPKNLGPLDLSTNLTFIAVASMFGLIWWKHSRANKNDGVYVQTCEFVENFLLFCTTQMSTRQHETSDDSYVY